MNNQSINQSINQSVGIFGAGIAGLSAAHELCLAGYSVHLFESSDSIGGMAKSHRYPNGLPSEYSWRGYGQFYKNVFDIMKQIPGPNQAPVTPRFDNCKGVMGGVLANPNESSVYSTELSRPIQFILTKDDTVDSLEASNWTKNFSVFDWSVLFLQMVREICSDHRTSSYAAINATEFLKQKIDNRNLTFISSIYGPWLGIDPHRTSLHHLFNFFRLIQYPDLSQPYVHPADSDGPIWLHGSGSQWLTLKRPTSEAWFDPWASYLTKNFNLKIHLKHRLDHFNLGVSPNFNIKNNEIDSVTLFNHNNQPIKLKFDYYIMATTPFAAADIIKKSPHQIQTDPQLKLFKHLISDGPHIQVSFRIGFFDKIIIPKKYMAFILPDSEFNLTFYFQDYVWHPQIYLGPFNQSLISGTACISYQPGKLFGKTIMNLTEEEFKQEILFQINKSQNFNQIIANYNNGKTINQFKINVFEIWKGWTFKQPGEPRDLSQRESQTSQAQLQTNELKWVNSTNTHQFMPEIRTSFNNLFLAGAHIKSSVDLYSMETACATGRDAALNIIGNGQRAQTVEKPLWMTVASKIDNFLYSIGAPHLIDIIILLTIIMIYLSVYSLYNNHNLEWIQMIIIALIIPLILLCAGLYVYLGETPITPAT